jgi:ribosomal-protein-alanine N-acetyltransferase
VEHIDDIMVVEKLSFSIPWSREAFFEEVTGNKFALYLSAVLDGKVIGYAGMWGVLDEGHITNIAVHPEFRGKGVGSLLLQGLIDTAGAKDILSMTLEVRSGNVAAQGLYTKFGFEVKGIRKGYYADNGEDALIMWKYGV